MGRRKLEWITGSGGPLLLLARERLDDWSGIDPPLGERVIKVAKRWDPEHPATDYDRACEVAGAFATLDIGGGHGIVLGGEPYPTTFVPRPDGGTIVRWIEAPSEKAILDRLLRLEVDADAGEPGMIEAHPGPLVLFDAACPGPEVEEDSLEVAVHPGRYLAGAIEHTEDGLSLYLVRLTRVG